MKKLLLASAMTLAMVSVAYAQGAATPAAPAAPTVNGAMGKPMTGGPAGAPMGEKPMPMGGAAGDMGKPMPAGEMEKCYGVAKAGKNDCATAAHSCAGNSKTDGEAWLNTPKGLCDKIVGGSTKPKA